MPWVEDQQQPQGAPQGGSPGTGWVEDAPATNDADAPWYMRLLHGMQAGARSRFVDRAGERQAFDAENPIAAAVRNATPFGLGEYLPNSVYRGKPSPTLSGLITGQQPSGAGPLETAAHAQTLEHAAADKRAGIGEGVVGSLGYGLGDAPETLLLPELRLARGGGMLAGGANAAVTGAAQGATADLANDRNPLYGAGLGAVAGIGGKAVGGTLGKVFNFARGVWEDPALQAADAAARAQGVNPRVGDLSPESAFRKFEDVAKFVPGSGAPAVMKQQAQTIGGNVSDFLGGLADPIAGKMANGDTPEMIVAQAAKDAHKYHSAVAGDMFDAVPKDVTVEPSDFLPAIRHAIGQYGDIFAKVDAPADVRNKVMALLNPPSALTDVDKMAMQTVGNVNPALRDSLLEKLSPGIGERMQQSAPPSLTAGEAHWIQSELGSVARALETQTSMGQRTGGALKAVSEARSALVDDMGRTEQVSEPFADARKYFRDNVVPYREDPFLRGLIEGHATDGDKLFNAFGKDDVGRARDFMQRITPEGQAALRYGLAARAGNAAVDDNFASGLSIAKLRKNFDIGNEIGQNRSAAEIFTPEQQAAMTGMRDTAQLVDRSATWAHNPHTGAQNIPYNVGKGALATAAGVGVAGLGPLGALLPLAPIAGARLTTALSRSPLFKRAYFAGGGTPFDNILEALAANGAATNAPSLLDYMGQQPAQ